MLPSFVYLFLCLLAKKQVVAGVGIGHYKDYNEACDKMVKISRSVEPNPEMKEIYEAKYERYKKTVEALDPIWKDFA